MTSREAKMQLCERRAELAQRRIARSTKARDIVRMVDDKSQTGLALRTIRDDVAQREVGDKYALKAQLQARREELDRRAVAAAKADRHREMLWRSPTVGDGGMMGSSVSPNRGGEGEAADYYGTAGPSSQLVESPAHDSPSAATNIASGRASYAFAKGSTAAPIRNEAYERLMNCGEGKLVLRHMQAREGGDAEAGGNSSARAQQQLSYGSPSPTSARGGYGNATPSLLAGVVGGVTPRSPMSTARSRMSGGTNTTPIASSAIADSYVQQYAALSHNCGAPIRWK